MVWSEEMLVYFEEKRTDVRGRRHPWTTSELDERGRYYNFKAHPELIREVIEDLRPHDHYDAIQLFYEMLERLNSPASELETNDVIFRPPAKNPSTQFPKKLQTIGRLTVFFRRLTLNARPDDVRWLMGTIADGLRSKAPAFMLGCVGISTFDTLFMKIMKPGEIVVLRYWAWGDTPDETMGNLQVVLRNLDECLSGVTNRIKAEGKLDPTG